MATDEITPPAPQPPIASAIRLDTALLRPSRLAALTEEGLLIDVLARIGGEELGLLLPGCTSAEALQIVERLRSDMPAGLTASAGIAEWHEPGTAVGLIALADRALYQAKHEGRDRACVSAGAPSLV